MSDALIVVSMIGYTLFGITFVAFMDPDEDNRWSFAFMVLSWPVGLAILLGLAARRWLEARE